MPERKDADALLSRTKFLSNAGILVPTLLERIPAGAETIMVYERKPGRSLHSIEVEEVHLNQIIDVTNRIAGLSVPPTTKAKLRPRTSNLPQLKNRELQQLSRTHSCTKSQLLKRCIENITRYLENMQPVELSPHELTLVHGDLHNHNLLFEEQRLSAVTDLEEMGIGCPTQDFVRYVFCASARLPFYPSRLRYEQRLLDYIMLKTTFTDRQWAYGFNYQVLRTVAKALALSSIWRIFF